MRKWIVGGAVVISSLAMAAPAFAGEINGQGNPPGGEGLGTLHAHSICAFSGPAPELGSHPQGPAGRR